MNLELAILNVLMASPNAIPVGVIAGHVSHFTGKPETIADLNAGLKRLEQKGHAHGTANQDRGTLWKETDDGRLRAA